MVLRASEIVLLAFGFILLTGKQGTNGQDFGYDGNIGPTHWGEKYEHCVGKHQSPINIEEHQVQLVKLLPMIFSNFDWKPESATLKNNGHTVAISLNSRNVPSISGGPLIGNYDFFQLHFHWGANDEEGSENTINNSSFPLELHMVFFQKAYGTYEAANDHPDGLTVLSFLFSNSKNDNVNYTPILEALPRVEEPHSSANMTDFPFLRDLIPDDLSVYFTYGGSLTTPPCSEVVTWIEFKNTVKFSHNQLEIFRQLNSENGKLSHNFRPVQPLHGRTIRMNRGTRNQWQSEDERDKKDGGSNTVESLTMISVCLILLTNVFS